MRVTSAVLRVSKKLRRPVSRCATDVVVGDSARRNDTRLGRFQAALLCAAVCFAVASAVPVVGAGVARAAGPDPEGTIYVADDATNAVDVFPPGASGNVAPERVIEGADTGIDEPGDVKVSSAGDVYVSNFGGESITEYAPQASGDATPICTISGSNTGLDENDDMSLEADGTLVVGNFTDAADDGGSVVVFAPGSCGNVTPVETIEGSNTGFNIVDGVGSDAAGTIYADSSENGSVQVFPPGTNGNVTPEGTISGSNTGLGSPDDIVVGFDGELYVTSGFDGAVNSVTVYAPGAIGNATPLQDITGSNTDFGLPDDLALDASGNIYVTDSEATVGPAVLEFGSEATGNVSPVATLTGAATTLQEPEGVAVAGPPLGASLTSTTSSPSIALGSSTHDTAIVSGGTSPTGSIEFKLFGPNDPACSAKPAYVAPLSTVDGDGSRVSPSFTPTALGTYRWVDLYSGDKNNAAVSTACNDPAETVTVTAPPVDITPPVITGEPKAGSTLTCSKGTWTNDPTSYTYQWYRNGTPLAGFTGPTYTLGTLDEGTSFTCVVTAINAAGQASATSNTVKVPIPFVRRCPGATGTMTGTRIGQIQLGMTRGRARFLYRRHSNRGKKYEDFFCLTPIGVRVGYASPKLLKGLSKRERAGVRGRVVWSSTSDPYYSLDGIRAGESITTASRVLGTEPPFHIGRNYWYLARKPSYTAVLKVRGGVVEELGIADTALTTSRGLQSILMHSFY